MSNDTSILTKLDESKQNIDDQFICPENRKNLSRSNSLINSFGNLSKENLSEIVNFNSSSQASANEENKNTDDRVKMIVNSYTNSCFKNPNSIESAQSTASPTGSLEQFDVNTAAATPSSLDDASAESPFVENLRDMNNSISNCQENLRSPSLSLNNLKPLGIDSSFRFRRHSSQSSINLAHVNNTAPQTVNLVSPLTITPSASNGLTGSDRICSSPINSLKMSSRVCQIKIDEGIEPHLSREIKSERETQNTLKLKSSCDELMLNADELESFSFNSNTDSSNNRNNIASPSFLNASTDNKSNGASLNTFRRYRTFSETLNANQTNNIQNSVNNGSGQNHLSSMPSPSLSSCYSYSNSSSPNGGTSFISNTHNSNTGLLRCFSPSTTLTLNNSTSQSNHTLQNYFSQSPSPTRKLFVTRRSMSPIPYNLRPSSLGTGTFPNSGLTNKRKLSDLDQNELNSSLAVAACSPKRCNTENQQEFVQPLLVYTGNNQNTSRTLNRSIGSSPSSLANTPSSPIAPSSLSLIITANNKTSDSDSVKESAQNSDASKSIETIDDSKQVDLEKINDKSNKNNSLDSTAKKLPISVWSRSNQKSIKNNEDTANKYTFVPIQLPLSSSNFSSQYQSHDKRLNMSNLPCLSASSSSFSSLTLQNTNQMSNSPLNSPARYFCDSPIGGFSPSVSGVSSSVSTDKPDSGYQSSVQLNSDSESCI